MVTKSEYEANQKKYQAAQATATAMQGTPGAPGSIGSLPITGDASLAGPLDTSGGQGTGLLNLPPAERERLMRITPGLGVASGVGNQIAHTAMTNAEKKLIYLLSGVTVLNSFIAAAMSLPNSIIGKQANVVASEAGFEMGDVRLMAFEQMFTTPVQDPRTGEWTFLFTDEKELQKRMAEVGIEGKILEDGTLDPNSMIARRIIQLQQIRAANSEIIQAAGPIGTFEQQTGELPFTAAQRVVKEQIAGQQPANAQGMTVAQVQQLQNEFEGAQRQAEQTRQLRERVPDVEELNQIPPGQLTPEVLEKLLKQKTPNETPETTVPSAAEEAKPASTGGYKLPQGAQEKILQMPTGFPPGSNMVWDPVLKRWVQKT